MQRQFRRTARQPSSLCSIPEQLFRQGRSRFRHQQQPACGVGIVGAQSGRRLVNGPKGRSRRQQLGVARPDGSKKRKGFSPDSDEEEYSYSGTPMLSIAHVVSRRAAGTPREVQGLQKHSEKNTEGLQKDSLQTKRLNTFCPYVT
ncbi:unnamed protein product [Nesidiocoris tenuis]|uniref:Uncharacterized protein n=1 Tax=Nesidiocoris tenuis TaxID=355587 RepID=A0A6H5G2E9_9HEMI|nr:unnamed protein product [Nesidiocoris tenuis]